VYVPQVRQMVTCVYAPPLRRWSGLDSVSTLSAILSAAFVMVMFGVYLLPYEAVLFATRDAICGGESGERTERGGEMGKGRGRGEGAHVAPACECERP
jgi:hypothetical protein